MRKRSPKRGLSLRGTKLWLTENLTVHLDDLVRTMDYRNALGGNGVYLIFPCGMKLDVVPIQFEGKGLFYSGKLKNNFAALAQFAHDAQRALKYASAHSHSGSNGEVGMRSEDVFAGEAGADFVQIF